MPRNKYQRRRALRPATAAPSLIQNELFQHPVQQPKPTAASSDLGREAARQLRERRNRNTRYIDKPEPTTNRNLLLQAQGQQQAASRSVQRQVLGQQSTSSLKPSGRFSAPSIPSPASSPLSFSGGAVRLNPALLRGNLIAAGIGIVLEAAAQPAIGWLAEKLARGIYEGGELVFGDTDGITFDQWQQIHDQVRQSVQAKRNRGISPSIDEIQNEIEVLRQKLVNPVISHSQETPAADNGKQPITPLQTELATDYISVPDLSIARASSHSLNQQNRSQYPEQTPLLDDRNAEYHQRRIALGDNPTKEQMDAVRDYGLDQHMINFPMLYQEGIR